MGSGHRTKGEGMELTVEVSQEVLKDYPAQVTAWFGPVAVPGSKEEVRAVCEQLGADCSEKYAGRQLEDLKSVQHWRSIFQRMGASAKYKSSIESLSKRFLTSGELWQIHPIVDLCNYVSLMHETPMASYDIAHIAGTISLRIARKGELFVPLGNPKQVEKTKNNEVVYSDNEKVICRYWNFRDCHHTRIVDETAKVIFIADLTNREDTPAESIGRSIGEVLASAFAQDIVPHFHMLDRPCQAPEPD